MREVIGRDKDSRDVVSGRDEGRFDEFRVMGTGFYTITESTLNYRENSFNLPSLTV